MFPDSSARHHTIGSRAHPVRNVQQSRTAYVIYVLGRTTYTAYARSPQYQSRGMSVKVFSRCRSEHCREEACTHGCSCSDVMLWLQHQYMRANGSYSGMSDIACCTGGRFMMSLLKRHWPGASASRIGPCDSGEPTVCGPSPLHC
jgi:hypothetical protein